jgi:hypothetical protein
MPWINVTLRRGAFPKPVQHAMMAKLTEVLMWWEKVPYTPAASKIMKGWVYEVAEDADSNVGSPDHFFREHLAYPDDFVENTETKDLANAAEVCPASASLR